MPVKTKKKSEAYDKRKKGVAELLKRQSAFGRDIAPLPPIADIERRESCRTSLRRFMEVYNPDPTGWGWSEDQLEAIARIEECVFHGAMYAFAMPRGSRKTVITRHAALWAISYGHVRYVFIISATADKAEESLNALKIYMRFLPAYAADFPEISHPVQRLNGVSQGAHGQLWEGRSTMIKWSQDCVVLPTVGKPENWPASWALRPDGMVPTSGSIIKVSGLTGEGIVGSLHTLTTGESVRPDLVLLDDPQSSESARSPMQNITREHLISADVLGMAAPGKALSAVMPCTVKERGDMVDQILDRSKHPLWRGQRRKMLPSMPTNLDEWEKYFPVYRACAQLQPPDFAAANAAYLEKRAVLDLGAVASWEQRKLDWEVSAVQHAMHLYARDPGVFASEYQNEPLRADTGTIELLTAVQVARKVNGVARGMVPIRAAYLSAMIDVHDNLLFWAVLASAEDFTSWIVDYGVWPGQPRRHFTLRNATVTMPSLTPGAGREGSIRAGLDALGDRLLARDWPREDGAQLRIGRCLVDAGYVRDVVFDFCSHSAYAAVLMPSLGAAVGAVKTPMRDWPVKPGETRGWFWLVTKGQDRVSRFVRTDINHWKSFLHARFAAQLGDVGSLSVYGHDPLEHELFAEHVVAESPTRVTANGRTVDEWKTKPGLSENHWLDVLVGCAAAASMQGAKVPAVGGKPEAKRPRLTLAEMKAKAQLQGAKRS